MTASARAHRLPWLLTLAVLIFVLDRLTKTWVSRHIPMGGAIPVIPHFLRITHWTNVGAAFSLFGQTDSPHAVRWFLVTFSSAAALGFFLALIRFGNRINRLTIAMALILAGALGNVHDRIAYGSVVDFIEVHVRNYYWPDFNVADSSVVIGACLLLLDAMLPKKSSPTPQPPSHG